MSPTLRWKSKSPPVPIILRPTSPPALPARPHLPFTLCALTSLPMRVIGISKRWRGQKGTQPHPENLIGESLEAQHSKGESLLNYIYIHAHTFFHSRSVGILSLFRRLFIITWESSRNISHSNITFFPRPSPPSPFSDFSFHFGHSTFSLMFLPFHLEFYFKFHIIFHFLWPFRYKPPALGFHLWISADYSIEHLTDISSHCSLK